MNASARPSLRAFAAVGRREAPALLAPLSHLAARGLPVTETTAGTFRHGGRTHALVRYDLRGPDAGHEPIRLGLFAGIHGDEPAGCLALVEFAHALAAAPARAAGYALTLFPVCNPVGLSAGTRENGHGRDLNREFWRGSAEPEVVILEAQLRSQRFDGIITLHTDDTSEGLYGYAHGRVLNEALLKPALAAAARVLPRDARPRIDGFTARESVLCECFPGVLAADPAQRPRPFDLIFETPGHAALDQQVRAATAALDSILAEYRGFLAYAQDL